jgi:hypothetical protein
VDQISCISRLTANTVESTTLKTVTYDAEREVLELEFRDRRTYQYFAVPVEAHDALLRAPSKGNYFNRMIRGHFAYERSRSSSAED